MPPPSSRAKGLADALRAALAQPGALTRDQARLYSHAVRLSWGASGLSTWTIAEAERLLVDAMRLVEAAQLEDAAGDHVSARDCYKKSGELLEWLHRSGGATAEGPSTPIPMQMLAACCYQLAEYPAMAAMLIAQTSGASALSIVVGSFVQGRFERVLAGVPGFWNRHRQFTTAQRSNAHLGEGLADDEDPLLTVELVRCLGAISHALVVDQSDRILLCTRKLQGLAAFASRTADSHTWLLLNLLAEIAARFVRTSVHQGIALLGNSLSDSGVRSAKAFARVLFEHGRGLLWPTQELGLRRLAEQRSAAICTPTGSGKTTIAEFAILQGLHPHEETQNDEDLWSMAPLAVYLVPSRALAAEVEARLAVDFRDLPSGVMVTGLYGGTEWSIADAWLTSDRPTVLVATVEKTDALLRFLGPIVYPRLRLVVLDEAHHVDLGDAQYAVQQLLQGHSRQARLEQLIARMMSGAPQSHCVALSAVAGRTRRALALWISEGRDNEPIGSEQRSTRQVLGVLECTPNRSPTVQVEAIDGQRLEISGREDAPYVPMGFPRMPAIPASHRNSMPAYLQLECLWCAMHLAAGNRNVLISIMQGIETVAKRFVEMLTQPRRWSNNTPLFFSLADAGRRGLFDACLRACHDYCGSDAFETRLLALGIAVHHGQLPVRVRRLMTDVIRQRITPIALATSTLTEGVNLPFDVILLPGIVRSVVSDQGAASNTVPVAEFQNLAGRAGRPGSNIEGMTLIAHETEVVATGEQARRRQRRELPVRRNRLTMFLRDLLQSIDGETSARSGIAELMRRIEVLFRAMQPGANAEGFETWLAQCIPEASPSDMEPSANQAVDLLDQHVLGLLVEAEQLLATDAPWADFERQLQSAWAHTYARYASHEAERLERLITRRGRTLRETVYPDRSERRKLYRMGLPPKRAASFLDQATRLEAHLATGGPYAQWSEAERLAYILRAAELVQEHAAFRMSGGTGPSWRDVLPWWLGAASDRTPSPETLRRWQRVVSECFEYRLCAAITATIGIALDRISEGNAVVPRIEEWRQQTSLPWSAFWLRELVAWGTLDPVAAYLLSQDGRLSRNAAEAQALEYYSVERAADPGDWLDPRLVRQWAHSQIAPPEHQSEEPVAAVRLLREFPTQFERLLPVVPSIQGDRVQWMDAAGYVLADSVVPSWYTVDGGVLDFVLDPRAAHVRKTPAVG